MTSSELSAVEAEAILDEIFSALAEERMVEGIDAPVDEVAESMLAGPLPEPTEAGLRTIVIGFMKQVEQARNGEASSLPDYEALARGISILQARYDVPGSGWLFALADVAERGIEAYGGILVCLAQATKERQREAYREWVLARHFRYRPWEERRALARAFRSRWSSEFPSEVAGCSLDEITEMTEELILNTLEADHVLAETLAQFSV